MKRITFIIATLCYFTFLSAQKPQENIALNDITFVRQSFVRNFYTTSKIMSQINMEGTDLFLPNAANLIIENRGSTSIPSLRQPLVLQSK